MDRYEIFGNVVVYGFILWVIWKFQWSRYWFKTITIALSTLIISIIFMFPGCLYRRDYRNARAPAFGVRWLLALFRLTFEVQGSENINQNKGGIVLVNQQSFIDIGVLSHLWPLIDRATIVSRKIILYIYTPSFFFGTVFVDISKSKSLEAIKRLSRHTETIKERNAKLVIFPEGERHEGDRLLPFKKGPFYIAIQSQCMIYPVVVQRYTFLDSAAKRFDSGHSIIKILPEIDCKGLTKSDLPQLMARTQALMQAEYDALNGVKSKKN